MDIVLFLMSIPLVCFGVYLCGDFLIWKYRAEVLEGEVMGFQKAKSKGRLLPVMRILGDKNKIETNFGQLNILNFCHRDTSTFLKT